MNRVSEKIYADAKSKLKEIERVAGLEIEKKKKEYKTQVEGTKKTIIENLKKLKNEELTKIKAEIDLENKNYILAAKRELLKKLKVMVKSKFHKDRSLYKEYLFQTICKVVKNGNEMIYLEKSDKESYLDYFTSEFNETDSGIKLNKKMFSENQQFFSKEIGIVIADGKIFYDGRLDSIVDRMVKKYEVELSKMIFR